MDEIMSYSYEQHSYPEPLSSESPLPEQPDPEEKYPVQQIPLKTIRGMIILIVLGMIIMFITGMILSPFLFNYATEEEPIYQQYTEFEGEYRLVYKNDKLNVTITRKPAPYQAYQYLYDAEWVDIDGLDSNAYNYSTPSALYNAILEYAEEITENQLKWFDYMFKSVIS